MHACNEQDINSSDQDSEPRRIAAVVFLRWKFNLEIATNVRSDCQLKEWKTFVGFILEQS